MTSMHGEEDLLKRDVLGRVHTPAQRRKELLEEFDRSGVGAAKFAQMVGVKYQTFASWVQKRRRGAAAPAGELRKSCPEATTLRLVEVVPHQEAPAQKEPLAGLVVQLPGGLRVEMHHREQAALVVALMEALEFKSAGPC